MFIPLLVATLGQIAIAAKSPGLFVYDKTGPLTKFTGSGSKVTWRSNGEMLPKGDGAGLAFVPTVHNETVVGNVQSVRDQWLQDPKITHILSFELPHTAVFGSIIMDEAKAADLHEFWVSSVHPQLQVGAPSVYLDTWNDGYPWFDKFTQHSTEPCRFDFIPLEYMGDNVQEFKEWIERFRKYGKPIWVTRLACIHADGADCSEEEAISFMTKAVSYFRSSKDIDRWVWDGAHPGFSSLGDGSAMLKADGSLTSLGSQYLTL